MSAEQATVTTHTLVSQQHLLGGRHATWIILHSHLLIVLLTTTTAQNTLRHIIFFFLFVLSTLSTNCSFVHDKHTLYHTFTATVECNHHQHSQNSTLRNNVHHGALLIFIYKYPHKYSRTAPTQFTPNNCEMCMVQEESTRRSVVRSEGAKMTI